MTLSGVALTIYLYVYDIALISLENRTKLFCAHTLCTLVTIKKEVRLDAPAIGFLTYLTPFIE